MLQVQALTPADVAGICDHSFLTPPECFRGAGADPLAAYEKAVADFIAGTLALRPAPYAVCVRAPEARRLRTALNAAGRREIKVAVTVGFPLGDLVSAELKAAEASIALDLGAAEIDTVLRWRSLRGGQDRRVAADLEMIMEAATPFGAPVKVILEVCELTAEEISRACRICEAVGVAFVKTSTGYGRGGATVEAVRLMRESFSGGLKLAGGVKADNLGELLVAALGPTVERLDPMRIRIGETSLLPGNA